MTREDVMAVVVLVLLAAALRYLLGILDAARAANAEADRLVAARLEAKWLDEANGHPHPLHHPTYHVEALDEAQALQHLVHPARIQP